jgi:formate dehydrogenase iron-sulfur subunit
VGVGLEPACVKACPTGAIHFGTKEAMHEYADERIVDLKERGFANAGVYDPAGVGGTHVMYVLQHADRPGLYSGLPKDPHISPFVSLWKGVAKPLAVLAMAGAVVGSFFHYMKVGPIEPKEKAGIDGDASGDVEIIEGPPPPPNDAARIALARSGPSSRADVPPVE